MLVCKQFLLRVPIIFPDEGLCLYKPEIKFFNSF